MPRLSTSALVALLLSAGFAPLNAQGVTAHKTGENRTGSTKQCFYRFGGKEYTKTVEGYQLCPLSIEVQVSAPAQPTTPARPREPISSTAYKTGENRTGSTKQCFYRFGGKEYTKTVEGYQLCPLSIEVPQH